MYYPPVLKLFLIVCLAYVGAGAVVHRTDKNGRSGAGQTQFASIIVNERSLTGPNSSAHRIDGRIFVPIANVARALGDAVTIDAVSRSVTVKRQDGTTAGLDARLGQIRENGALVLSVSNAAEIVFAPNPDELLLPVEIVAPLLDAAIRYDDARNAVIVSRGVGGETAQAAAKNGQAAFELYQLDYAFDLNRYSGASLQNVTLTAAGRLGDGRFNFSSNSSFSSVKDISLRNGSFRLERPNGQRFAAGDLGTGANLQFLSSNLRGASTSIPWKGTRFAAFAGQTYSGSVPGRIDPITQNQPPVVTNNHFSFDTTVLGFYAAADQSTGFQPKHFNFAGGAMHFGGPDRSGDLGAGNINLNFSRFRLDGNFGLGQFNGLRRDGTRFSGFGEAIDLTGTFQVTDTLALQGRYAHIGKNFLTPQAGLREPVSLKAAGVTWSPAKWFSTSVNGSTARDLRDQNQNNKYITAAFTIAPGYWLPRLFVSHTESSSSQVRSAAFTTVTASKEFTRLRLFLNATRIKSLGPASLNVQLGANFSINDSNSIEFSQGAGNHGTLNGQFDWRTSGLFLGHLSFSAGGGYNYDPVSGFSSFERLSVSVALPRQTSLQVNYIQTNTGPTMLLSLRGSLFRKREAQAFLSSSTKEMNSFARVSGRVYQDNDLNGRYDAGVDKPQANVQVRVDGNRYVVSDENGVFRFDAVTSGAHKIYLDLLSVRADLTVLGEDSRDVDLGSGTNSIVDFRLVRTGRITGRAWLDANENGKFDPGETVLADVRVVTASGRDTLTDSGGFFTIGDLPPGEHVVLIDEKTIPDKTMAGLKPIAVSVLPGRETGDISLPVIMIPPEIKRFSGKPK